MPGFHLTLSVDYLDYAISNVLFFLIDIFYEQYKLI
jgi:hypothetical protein